MGCRLRGHNYALPQVSHRAGTSKEHQSVTRQPRSCSGLGSVLKSMSDSVSSAISSPHLYWEPVGTPRAEKKPKEAATR